MADDQIQNNPKDQPFVRKTVETPILAPSIREQISPTANFSSSEGGLRGFYRANKLYFWAIFAGVLIISVLAFFAFRKSAPATITEAKVSINVEVSETVPSGSEAVYKITVKNDDSQKLVNLQLELAYPEGMAYQSSSPSAENLSGSLFMVPQLIFGQNVAIFVKTKVTGNVGDKKTLNIKLHYKYANFNSEFIKQYSSTIMLTASDVAIELDGPASTNNAQLVVYTVKYQNNSEQELKSARVKMDYPDGFIFASATPAPSLGADTWDIGALAKAASGNIQIQGTFTATSPGESKTASAEFLILGNDGQFFIQNSSNFVTAISSLPLLVSQELSQSNSKGVINPGDSLSFSITYQNNASVVANGVNIAVSLDSKIVDLSSINAQGGQVNNNVLTWNAATVPQLENLAPNESGKLSFNLRINNPATKDSSKNLTLVSNIKIKSNEYDSFFPGSPLSLKVSSPASVNGSLSFVSGQLPPQVGRPTTYKVKLTLINSGNDFNSGVLTAFIPLTAGSFLDSTVTPGEKTAVQFDASTGKLTWNTGSVPAYAGRFGPGRILEFQITLNPSAVQAQTSPVLVKSISFTAKDSFTLEEISLTTQDITTRSLQGENGGSNSTVQP